jgi:hypothetical protein
MVLRHDLMQDVGKPSSLARPIAACGPAKYHIRDVGRLLNFEQRPHAGPHRGPRGYWPHELTGRAVGPEGAIKLAPHSPVRDSSRPIGPGARILRRAVLTFSDMPSTNALTGSRA